jgi:hypothetical protein
VDGDRFDRDLPKVVEAHGRRHAVQPGQQPHERAVAQGVSLGLRPRSPWVIIGAVARFALLIALIVAGALGAWLYLAPSSLLKLVAPKAGLQKIVLARSQASGTVINLQGRWFNEGKPTEIVIRSRRTPDGWNVPQNITIRNGRLRGSIRIQGLGRNGEAARVRESSVSEGHTARAQAAAPRGIVHPAVSSGPQCSQ